MMMRRNDDENAGILAYTANREPSLYHQPALSDRLAFERARQAQPPGKIPTRLGLSEGLRSNGELLGWLGALLPESGKTYKFAKT